jgi:hypothetical protein
MAGTNPTRKALFPAFRVEHQAYPIALLSGREIRGRGQTTVIAQTQPPSAKEP